MNAGKAPVRHDDILSNLVLTTGNNCPIYEATVRNVSREVIGFRLITNDLASGRLAFDWRILEHNDGASIQILYGGDQQLPFSINDGACVVGQNNIPFRQLSATASLGQRIGGTVVFTALVIVFISAMKDALKKLRKALHEQRELDALTAASKLLFLALLTIVCCLFLLNIFLSDNGVPFRI